jgi:hypothetical protein
LGLALILPWSASSQSHAAKSVVDKQGGKKVLLGNSIGFSLSPTGNTPLATDSERATDVSTRYYVAKTGTLMPTSFYGIEFAWNNKRLSNIPL